MQPDWKQRHTASSSMNTTGLPVHISSSTAVVNGICPAEPDHHVHTGLDIHTSQVKEISRDPGIRNDSRRLQESGRDQTFFHIIHQEHTDGNISRRNQVLSPLYRQKTTFANPRTNPSTRLDEGGNGTRYDMPMSARSATENQSYDSQLSDVAGTAHSVGDSHTQLPSSEAVLLSQSVGHDRSPSASGRSIFQSETDSENKIPSRSAEHLRQSEARAHNGREKNVLSSQTKVRPRSTSCDRVPSRSGRSRVQVKMDDDSIVPSRCAGHNRGRPTDSDHQKTVPSSQRRISVRSRSASCDRGPSADHSAMVRSHSNDDNTVYSHHERHLNPRHRSRSESSEVGRNSTEAEGYKQLSVCDNDDENVTGTSVWSEESPQHSVHYRSRPQLPQVEFLYLAL